MISNLNTYLVIFSQKGLPLTLLIWDQQKDNNSCPPGYISFQLNWILNRIAIESVRKFTRVLTHYADENEVHIDTVGPTFVCRVPSNFEWTCWYLEFFQKMNEKIDPLTLLRYLRSNYFCSFFGRNEDTI